MGPLVLQARRLDVAASPHDATRYGVGVIPMETSADGAQYRVSNGSSWPRIVTYVRYFLGIGLCRGGIGVGTTGTTGGTICQGGTGWPTMASKYDRSMILYSNSETTG